MQQRAPKNRRGVRLWSGKKVLVLSPEAAKQRRENHAAFQVALAAERERVSALAQHPDAVCSACGAKLVHPDTGKRVASCPKSCTALFGKQRSHAVVFEKQPLPNQAVVLAAQAKKLAEAKAAAAVPDHEQEP
jgi:hypothetical protein